MDQTPQEMVRARLSRLKGQWKRVADESGVPYTTIKNLMQGRVTDPRSSTIERLSDYLTREAQ